MTLKTGVMILKFQLCMPEINDSLDYIELENSSFNCNNISQYYGFLLLNKCSWRAYETSFKDF